MVRPPTGSSLVKVPGLPGTVVGIATGFGTTCAVTAVKTPSTAGVMPRQAP